MPGSRTGQASFAKLARSRADACCWSSSRASSNLKSSTLSSAARNGRSCSLKKFSESGVDGFEVDWDGTSVWAGELGSLGWLSFVAIDELSDEVDVSAQCELETFPDELLGVRHALLFVEVFEAFADRCREAAFRTAGRVSALSWFPLVGRAGFRAVRVRARLDSSSSVFSFWSRRSNRFAHRSIRRSPPLAAAARSLPCNVTHSSSTHSPVRSRALRFRSHTSLRFLLFSLNCGRKRGSEQRSLDADECVDCLWRQRQGYFCDCAKRNRFADSLCVEQFDTGVDMRGWAGHAVPAERGAPPRRLGRPAALFLTDSFQSFVRMIEHRHRTRRDSADPIGALPQMFFVPRRQRNLDVAQHRAREVLSRNFPQRERMLFTNLRRLPADRNLANQSHYSARAATWRSQPFDHAGVVIFAQFGIADVIVAAVGAAKCIQLRGI